MATSFTVFNQWLPATATELLNRSERVGGPVEGLPSYFNATISNGGLLDGFYDAWCIRTDKNIVADATTLYNVNVY